MEVTSLSEKLLFTTVKIDTISPAGVKGSGTGFLFSHKFNGNDYPFVVTNKHVVQGADKGGITFVKKKTESSRSSVMLLELTSVTLSPSGLATLKIALI